MSLPLILLLIWVGVSVRVTGLFAEPPAVEVREVQAGEFQYELRQGLELEFINHSKTAARIKVEGTLSVDGKALREIDEAITVPPGQRRGARIAGDRAAGHFQVRYRVTNLDTQETLAERSFAFESGGPLTVNLWPFYLGRNGVLARCFVDAFGEERGFQWTGRLLDATGETIAEASLETADKHVHLPLFAESFPAGRYETVVEVRNERDVLLGRRRTPFERPGSPDWWTANAGKEPAVPESWTPIQIRPKTKDRGGRVQSSEFREDKDKRQETEQEKRKTRDGEESVQVSGFSVQESQKQKAEEEKPRTEEFRVQSSEFREDGKVQPETEDKRSRSVEAEAQPETRNLKPETSSETRNLKPDTWPVVAEVWGREYEIGENALPARIRNQDEEILTGPVRLDSWSESPDRRTGHENWTAGEITRDEESVTFASSAQHEDYSATVSTRLEFDGFMLINLTLEPQQGMTPTVKPIRLRIPLDASYATHLTNYRKAPGYGEAVPRYVGKVPAEGTDYTSPVFLTTWLGGDEGGLEWSAESSKGWSLEDPQEAIRVWKEKDTVWFEARFVSRPFVLDKARTITFGLVATPTKPFRKDAAKWRIYDNIQCWHLPYDWAGYEAWHPEATDPERLQTQRAKYDEQHELGRKVLVNGGWAISEVAPQWPTWSLEMVAEPLAPTIWDQYDGCYNTPYVEFMVGSFAANARKLGFDGIRFDTVVPWKPCTSEWHGCAWRGDDGQLYGTQNLWRQREMMKRIYRIFHGGVVDGGIIYLPVAGPPLMCIESFEDIHEIGEGYYMKAESLKEGYPQERARVWMTGKPYGFVVQNSIKGEPLAANERIGALLAAGGNPRFAYNWDRSPVDYDRNSRPAVAIWDAWDWIDLSTAEWRPHWQNHELISVEPEDKEIYASFHLQPGRKILLVLANYEKEQLNGVKARLSLERLEMPATLYGRDAITLETIALEDDELSVSILPERYRLIQISNEPFPPADSLIQSRAQKAPDVATDFTGLRLGKNALYNPDFEEWAGDEHRDELDEALAEDGAAEPNPDLAGLLPDGGKRPSLKKWRDEWADGSLNLIGWSSLSNKVADHAFREKDVKRSGEYAVRIEAGRGFYIIQYLPVRPNTRYAVEAWVKVDGHLGEGRVVLGVEGNLGGSANTVTEDTGDWQRLAGIIETPEEIEQASYQIRLFGKGTIWVDDLSMRPILEE